VVFFRPYGLILSVENDRKGTTIAVSLPNGTTYSLATVYATALSVTIATNASEAVLTATNTLAVGDYVEYTCSWTRANNRIFRLKAASGTTVTLEGFDTTSVILFPVGSGVGSIRKITTWLPISQVVSCDSSGGEPKYASYEFLESDTETSIPSGFSAQSLAMVIADDPTLAHHAALKSATETKRLAGLKAALPVGGFILYNSFVAFDETPSLTKGQIMAVKAGYALQGRPVRYAT
jgi:hypothetical protein